MMENFEGKRSRSAFSDRQKRLNDSEACSSNEVSQCNSGSAGTIESVELINFMCHDHLRIQFQPGVNFICGRNGTGKSAILSALVIGLGGRASDTSRGYSLKEFIKTGEHSSVIKIVINNRGFKAYQPELYSDTITVQRTIGPTSSQYKLMSADGVLVSTKHEDLVRMLMHLNLQVDNPVAILTQDTARNFLHNTKPTDKYIFFLKATRLEPIQAIYKKVSETLAATRITQSYRLKRLNAWKEEKNQVEKSLKRLQSVEKTKDLLEAAQNEYVWANVRLEEEKLKKIEESINEQETIHTKIIEEISQLDQKIITIGANKTELEAQSEAMVEEGKDKNSKCNQLKVACEKINNLRKSKLDEISSRKEEINRLTKNIESISKQIEDLQVTLDNESQQTKEDLEKHKKDLEDEKTEVEAKMKTHQHHHNQLEAASQNDKESLKSLDQELAGLNLQISQLKTTLNSLEGKEEGMLRLFGPHTMALNREIKLAFEKGMFTKMPRGPVGSFLKVKDKSWAPAVESVIGGDNLRSYIVNDHQDRKVLYNLIKKVTRGNGPVPSVVATKFMDKIYDYQSHSVNCPGYSNVLNMLEVSDHIVANSLMDLLSIETTLLVNDPRAAREMMMDERNVPKNCKKVVTKSGDTYYPDPNYRCYSGDDRTQAKFLQVSVEDAKREMLAEITSVKKWAENTLSQKSVVGKRLQMHKGEIQAAKKVLDQLSNKKLSLKQQIMDLQRSNPVDANQINFWVEEKNTLKTELENLELLLEQSNGDYKDIQDSYKNMVDQYNALKEESKSKSREIDSMVSKCHQLDNKLMKAKSLLDDATKKKQEYLKFRRKMEHQVTEQKKLVEAATKGALKLSKERVDSKRSISEINEEIRELKNEIERVERIEGNPRELWERYSALKSKCDKLTNEMSITDHCDAKFMQMLKHRKEVYTKCLQLIATRMQILFQAVIDRRRFQGGIEIDHKERKLDIKVTLRNPSLGQSKCGSKRAADSGDPKSLSGGERSFATVAFIISMWDALELPCYALDEFDVYMDNANREITLDLLTTHAMDKEDYQYLFLTPQPINPSIQSDRIHIFNLESHEAQIRAMAQ